jgi:hypothetical protein
MKWIALILLAGVIAVSGCISPAASLGEPFTLGIGDEKTVEGAGISVMFIGVTEDSRCPSDVVCIWEGQTSAELRVKKGADVSDMNLTIRGSGGGMLNAKNFEGYTVTLTKVDPYPDSGGIDEKDYVVTLVVTKV